MKVRQLSDSKGLSYLHLVTLSLYAILLGVLVGLIDAVFWARAYRTLGIS